MAVGKKATRKKAKDEQGLASVPSCR